MTYSNGVVEIIAVYSADENLLVATVLGVRRIPIYYSAPKPNIRQNSAEYSAEYSVPNIRFRIPNIRVFGAEYRPEYRIFEGLKICETIKKKFKKKNFFFEKK